MRFFKILRGLLAQLVVDLAFYQSLKLTLDAERWDALLQLQFFVEGFQQRPKAAASNHAEHQRVLWRN